MTNRAATFFGAVAIVAQAFAFQACSSSGSAAGTGGTTGTGSGGSVGTGSGGATGAGTGGAAGPYAAVCASGVKNHGLCTDGVDVQCSNTCGPLKSGYKNCDCSAGAWNCPVCAFPAGQDYSCYHLPTPIGACPANPANVPTMLPKSGDPCTLAVCMPCGSGVSNAYLDSTNTPKIGYCVCTASDGTGVYSCASTTEWPPQ